MKNRLLMTALVGFLAFGCGEDDEPAANNQNNTTPTNNSTTPNNTTPTNNSTTPNNTTPTNNNNTTTNNETNNETNNSTNNSTNNNNNPVVASCEAIQATSCLYTFDCETVTDVCETQNNPDQEVRCCVPGTRGTKTLGEACDAENDCASGACLNDLCAEPCDNQNMCPTDYTCQPALGLCVPE